ncbi:NAD(+)--dinitrogen-reductase ADP-D-ribosyltransferase [Oceanobacter mangrovi]|uniref:NAD(+)--dinitrogen-reductase ADP-D-ribosyltransferase n=1 Tax=Oceanobacter mangrovi TaxID=2862510 RepID=UPI001C8DF9BF|nr:NAD(+)--dinitrogen-reductase ADP-D-ribosyltransferase [Oceanobacter mangrovi]
MQPDTPAIAAELAHNNADSLPNGDRATANHRAAGQPDWPVMPVKACLPINRCNLPAKILASLSFQQHPAPLLLDGVLELHKALFHALDQVADASQRAMHFMDYMRSSFLLEHPDRNGLQQGQASDRSRADYLKLLRGWMFNPDGIEAAVLKGWVESRFGLLPRFHHQPIDEPDSNAYHQYVVARMTGLYNANSLESQLDLLYSWCQYELGRRLRGATGDPQSHIVLYRGSNDLQRQLMCPPQKSQLVLCLNSLNSFSSDADTAGSFGDVVIRVDVPVAKLLYVPGLLPCALKGEEEYLVVGGLYRATRQL